MMKMDNGFYFYDNDYIAELWGKNLAEVLQQIYSKQGKYCLMIISDIYLQKMWTRHERRAALSRMVREEQEYILPYIIEKGITLDKVDGINPDILYLKVPEYGPLDVAELLLQKLKTPSSSRTIEILQICNFVLRELFKNSYDKDGKRINPYDTNYYRFVLRDMFFYQNRTSPHDGELFYDCIDYLLQKEILYVGDVGELGILVALTEKGIDLCRKAGENEFIDILDEDVIR